MTTYVPNPEDVTTPLDSDNIGNVTPAEIRSLKQHVIDKFAELSLLIDTAASNLQGRTDTLVNNTNTAISSMQSAVSTKLDPHLVNFDNPHTVTKSQIGLDKVENYPASSAINLASSTTYATALAAKLVNDNITSAASATSNVGSRLSTLENQQSTLTYYANLAADLTNRLNNLPTSWGYLERLMAGTGSVVWVNPSNKEALVIEVLTGSNLQRNPIKLIAPKASYTYNSADTVKAFCICFT